MNAVIMPAPMPVADSMETSDASETSSGASTVPIADDRHVTSARARAARETP